MYKHMMRVVCVLMILTLFVGCANSPDRQTDVPQGTESTPVTQDATTTNPSENPANTTVASTSPTTEATTEATTVPTTVPVTEPTTETNLPTKPTEEEGEHSPLYIPGVSADDVVRYFNEVCLDAEFVNGGDATLLQKWDVPIRYIIYGDPTEQDTAVLNNFTGWLNTVEGFPGIYETQDPFTANLRIYFCTESEMLEHLGDNFVGCDGGVTFWYMGNAIYDGIICYRTDILQVVRNSVILEEIYNGLGPVQDTWLRSDSIIYAGYSEPQSLTAVDKLILKLLYHPQLTCGMNAAACEAVIRQLYY